tara:strand:+ start:25877 stop:26719 length:843 start_codon:yes stop_codon:yes gene_type:complete
MSTAIDFSDLEGDFDSEQGNAPAKDDSREKFPCVRCDGSGTATWGYTHVRSGPCNVCKGKGYFLSSPQQRLKAKLSRVKRADARAADVQTAKIGWITEHAEVCSFLSDNASWSSFAASLESAIEKYGSLTEKQLASATSMMAKCNAKRAAKDAAKPTIDLLAINGLFKTAQDNGAKKPAIVVGLLRLSLAPSHGNNAGFIYVKDDGEYAGKISGTGVFSAVRSARPEVTVELAELAENPSDAMVKHGRATGQCSCCGRKLTVQVSIDAGIGPICAENYGF